MSIAIVRSRALTVASAPEVTVEAHLANGLPSFSVVGLPDPEVRESRERVRAALQNCHFEFPLRRITVNLAPADLPKESGHFDLPIALGILAASGQLPLDTLHAREFAGELSFTGALRPIRGAFAMACGLARQFQHRSDSDSHTTPPELYLPLTNAAEAALIPGIAVFGAPDLPTLCAHLSGVPDKRLQPVAPAASAPAGPLPDLAEIIGQSAAKRALEIAAAGAHHLLMIGPPGAGKSMLAMRLPGILPPMTDEEALTSAALLSSSAAGFTPAQWKRRPFRAPHHCASAAALAGGGNPPHPGEITLAHHGVLFLDELTEFDRRVLEMLREPLETGFIIISRAARRAEFPAACQLVAAMNPCPCGWLGDSRGRCRCAPDVVARYQRKLSGPLLERIDLQIEVPALAPAELMNRPAAESSAVVAARVRAAYARQIKRQHCSNRALAHAQIERLCQPDASGKALLHKAGTRFGWSARTYYRVLKVARTIADLAAAEQPDATHIAEAIQYRRALRRGCAAGEC
ncbi:Mg chelatase related protein [Candidatus Glomeribacter gigasporarum BEG34]|uniref:Mg chelatase related protein n=1 Tax=Candidatus Glomeribacter gigasporarum BEG34 TaxID=1070319 RepID=G2J8Q2_9BURK|nr:YifB family Mg chelatase-like AAA ATPase [Candidatus Glomeribacter gigasporarum]CCD29149.1 Mg chelatase related protein [Candidatus Glomeribacter gigasporarum BEG34]